MTYVHVVHGWVWKWGQQVGGNAIWSCMGGSSGRDDPIECVFNLALVLSLTGQAV